MSDKTETLPEAVAEVMPSEVTAALNKDKFDAIIAFSERIDKLSAAHQKIRFAVLKQALPGDFVRFGDKIELGGPGAERVRSFLGISFTNWKDWKEATTDKHGDQFVWWYQADATWQGVTMERVQGRAGSRDKFFGYEDGKWKELSDVREADIRTAARRCVIKEGTKLHLGLRGLPADDETLSALGLDPKKVKTVEFGKRGETKVDAAPAGTPVKIVDVKMFKGKSKKTGKDFVRYEIYDNKGAKYSTLDEKLATTARAYKDQAVWALMQYEVSQYGNDLKAIKDSPKEAAAAPAAGHDAPGDAQE